MSPPIPKFAVACATKRIPAAAPGGAAVHLRALARAFGAFGSVELWAARLDPGARGPAVALDVPVRLLPPGHLPGVLRRRRAWDEGIDAAAARRWARRQRLDLLYERAALFGTLGRLPGVARVVELNAPLAWEACWYEGEAPRAALLQAEARALSGADLVAVVSEPLVAYALRRGVPAERILLTPNGAEPVAEPSPGPVHGFVLGYAGTFKPWQGLLAAIPELAARPGWRLELWGDGPERAAFVQAAAAAGVPVRWRGWGSAAELAEARLGWSAAWVPLAAWPPPGSGAVARGLDEPVPGRYFSPLKEAEAAACGLPIWRGAGPPEPCPSPPPGWRDTVRVILERLDRLGVPAAGGSWFNAAGVGPASAAQE